MDEHDMLQESVLWPWVDDPGPDPENEDNYESDPPDDMDGDHESGLASAGFGTDEDYGRFDDDC